MKTLLCLGFGYTAAAFAAAMAPCGWRVVGTARSLAARARIEAADAFAVDWTEDGVATSAVEAADAVLISAPPDAAGCPAFRVAAARLFAHRRARWIGYLSTNGVYGDHGGAAIDETAPRLARSARGLARIAAEDRWREAAAEAQAPLVIFRLPGIYGPGRSAFDAIREGRAQRIVKPGQVFNRIHVDDIAAALGASLADPAAGALFNLADDEPAPPQDVITHACALLGVTPPPLINFADAALSPMARSFYEDNKRVLNTTMKRALKLSLTYPTYREGLAAILAAETARRAGGSTP